MRTKTKAEIEWEECIKESHNPKNRNFLEDYKAEVPHIWIAYRSIGGRKDKIKFTKILGEFYEYTFDSYIFGDCELHGGRQESWDKWIEATNITNREALRIFSAVDLIHPYT